jgi:hypothetical protein
VRAAGTTVRLEHGEDEQLCAGCGHRWPSCVCEEVTSDHR